MGIYTIYIIKCPTGRILDSAGEQNLTVTFNSPFLSVQFDCTVALSLLAENVIVQNVIFVIYRMVNHFTVCTEGISTNRHIAISNRTFSGNIGYNRIIVCGTAEIVCSFMLVQAIPSNAILKIIGISIIFNNTCVIKLALA